MATSVPPGGVPPTLLISTNDYPVRDRAAVWREVYGRKVVRLEHEPLGEGQFCAAATLQMLPGLAIASVAIPPLRVSRTRELLADGHDDLVLQISSTPGQAAQLGREVAVGGGDAVVFSAADVGGFVFPQAARVLALSVPGRLSATSSATPTRSSSGLFRKAAPRYGSWSATSPCCRTRPR